MPARPHDTRMLSWGARLLYVGPSFALSPHRSAIGVLCLGLDGGMRLRSWQDDEPGAWITTRSVFVPGGLRHEIAFAARRIACLYVDPASADVAPIVARMAAQHGGFAVRHTDEKRLCDLMRWVLQDAPGALARTRVAEALDLPKAERLDPRVAAVLASLRAHPAQDASLAQLAQQVGLSPSRLRHLFRSDVGVPLKRYRIWTRIGAAMASVRHGASLTRAAHAAGFASSAHLSAAYRAMFGFAPSSFTRLVAASRKKSAAAAPS